MSWNPFKRKPKPEPWNELGDARMHLAMRLARERGIKPASYVEDPDHGARPVPPDMSEVTALTDSEVMALAVLDVVPALTVPKPPPPVSELTHKQQQVYVANWRYRILRGMTVEIAAHEAEAVAKALPRLSFAGVLTAALPAMSPAQRLRYTRVRRERRRRRETSEWDRDDALVAASRCDGSGDVQLELPL